MRICTNLWQAFSRRKTFDTKSLTETRLKRRLNTVDALGIGLGSSLGIGVYVIISYVVKSQAGPAAILSVIVAGIAALLSGLCYAEFVSRLPRAGSSYVYIYATLGELSAFIFGWTLILENVLGASAAAKAWSLYMDHLFNGSIHRQLNEHVSWMNGPGMSESPDLLSLAVLFIAITIVCLGTKIAATVSLLFTVLNGLVIFCIICVGFFHVSHENWTQPPGFFPFGFTGVLGGAACLFYVFISADTISSAAEETKEPTKTLPTVVLVSLTLTFILIFGVTLALTLIYPWNHLTEGVSLPQAYEARGIHGIRFVITFGGLLGLTVSTVMALFPVPKLLYSLANDGLIPRCVGNINTHTRTPLLAIGIVSLMTVVFTLFMELQVLIEILSIGTLASYSAIVISIICQRYHPAHVGLFQEYEDLNDEKYVQCTEFVHKPNLNKPSNNNVNQSADKYSNDVMKLPMSVGLANGHCNKGFIKQETPRGSTYQKMDSVVSTTSGGSMRSLFPIQSDITSEATNYTWSVSAISVIIFLVSTISFSLILVLGGCYILEGTWWTILLLIVVIISIICSLFVLVKQPQNQTKLIYKTPCVPFVPLSGLILNTLMMTAMSCEAWIRFSTWIIIGFVVYLSYGVHSSAERYCDEQEVILYEIQDNESRQYRPKS